MYCVENNACMFHGHASVVSLTLFKEKDRGGATEFRSSFTSICNYRVIYTSISIYVYACRVYKAISRKK